MMQSEEETELLKFIASQRNKFDELRSQKMKTDMELEETNKALEYNERLMYENTKAMNKDEKQIEALTDKFEKLNKERDYLCFKFAQYGMIKQRCAKNNDELSKDIEETKREKVQLEKEVQQLYATQLQLKSKESEMGGMYKEKEQEMTEVHKKMNMKLQDMKKAVDDAIKVNKRRDERNKKRIEIENEVTESIGGSSIEQIRKIQVAKKLYTSMLSTEVEKQETKSSKLAAAFMKIKASCGLTDVNDIVDKFLNREYTLEHLQRSRKVLEADILEQKHKNSDLRLTLMNLQTSGLANQSNRELYRELDKLTLELNEVEKKLATAVESKTESELIIRLLKQTMTRFQLKLDPSSRSASAVGEVPDVMDDMSFVELVPRIEGLILKLLKSVKATFNPDEAVSTKPAPDKPSDSFFPTAIDEVEEEEPSQFGTTMMLREHAATRDFLNRSMRNLDGIVGNSNIRVPVVRQETLYYLSQMKKRKEAEKNSRKRLDSHDQRHRNAEAMLSTLDPLVDPFAEDSTVDNDGVEGYSTADRRKFKQKAIRMASMQHKRSSVDGAHDFVNRSPIGSYEKSPSAHKPRSPKSKNGRVNYRFGKKPMMTSPSDKKRKSRARSGTPPNKSIPSRTSSGRKSTSPRPPSSTSGRRSSTNRSSRSVRNNKNSRKTSVSKSRAKKTAEVLASSGNDDRNSSRFGAKRRPSLSPRPGRKRSIRA